MSFEGPRTSHEGTRVPVTQTEPTLHEHVDVDVELEAGDVMLDSVAAVHTFRDEVNASILERLDEVEVTLDEEDQEQLSKLQTEFSSYLEAVAQKINSGSDPEEHDRAHVQEVYERLMDKVDALCVLDEAAPFDPELYIHEQFAEHPYLTATKRQMAYSLLREYKQILKESQSPETHESAERLALEIQEVVDELVGNDQITEEGVGFDVADRKTGVRLTLEDVRTEEAEIVVKVNTQPAEPIELEEEPDDIETQPEAETQPVAAQFAPASVQEQAAVSTDEHIDSREAQRQLLKAVDGIEAISTTWFSSILDTSQSPYQALANESFEDLVTYAQSNETRAECRAWLKNNDINADAFFNWMEMLPEMQALGVQTEGYSFKEVIDTFLQLNEIN